MATTSWGEVSEWYEEHLKGDDTYHAKVILPNLLRLMDIEKGENVLDLACGEGFFTRAFAHAGATAKGADISPELIRKAKAQSADIEFAVAPADKLLHLGDASQDAIACVLAIQNIENIKGAIGECKRLLKKGGRLFVVMNHPAFRIPKRSSWGWDEEKGVQYRRIDAYMSESKEQIAMHPSEANSPQTVSFHRPLQYYFKLLHNGGFAVLRLEEWLSHKRSEPGARSASEDSARKEIPLFLAIEAYVV